MKVNTSKYFMQVEFRNCAPPCTIDQMSQVLLTKMDLIRQKVGEPLVITSAFRASSWDKARGRSGNGAHTKGLAVDFACGNSALRMKIVRAALDTGIRRIGIGHSFVHIDIDETLPQDVIWEYGK